MSSLQTFSRLALKQFCALLEGVAVTESSTGDLECAMWEKIQAGNPDEAIRVPYPLIKKSLRKSKLELPYMPSIINYDIGCSALKVSGGLYLPCCGKCEEESAYCGACAKHELKYGVLQDRGVVGTYSDPTDKHEISFGTWLAKNEKTVEEVQEALALEGFIITIPSHYLTVNSKRIVKEVKARKGRPKAAKKEVTGDDSDSGSSSESEEKPKKKDKKAKSSKNSEDSGGEKPKKAPKKAKSPKNSDDESDGETPKKASKKTKSPKNSDGESEEKSEKKAKKAKSPKNSDDESDGEKPKKAKKAAKEPKKAAKEPKKAAEPEPEKKKKEKSKKAAEPEPEKKKKEKKPKSPKNSDGESDGEKVDKKDKKEKKKSKTEEPDPEKKKKEKKAKSPKSENSTDISNRFQAENSELVVEEYEPSGFDARAESFGEGAEEIFVKGTKYMLRDGTIITDIITGQIVGSVDEDGEAQLNNQEEKDGDDF